MEPDPILGMELELSVIAVVLKLVLIPLLLKSLAHLEDELVVFCELVMHLDRRASPGV
jgi:hypothetical protein